MREPSYDFQRGVEDFINGEACANVRWEDERAEREAGFAFARNMSFVICKKYELSEKIN
jgi:hypothetical protein